MKIPHLAQELEKIAKMKFLQFQGEPQYALKALIQERMAPEKTQGLLSILEQSINEALWWRPSSRQQATSQLMEQCMAGLQEYGYFGSAPSLSFKSIRNKLGLRRPPGLFLRNQLQTSEGVISLSSEKNGEFLLSSQFSRGKDLSSVGQHKENAYALINVVLHEATHDKTFKEGIVFRSPNVPEKMLDILNAWVAPRMLGLSKFYHEMISDSYATMILLKESNFDPDALKACHKLLHMRKNPHMGWIVKKMEEADKFVDCHTTQFVLERVLNEQEIWKDLSPDQMYEKCQEYATEGCLELLNPSTINERKNKSFFNHLSQKAMIYASFPKEKDMVLHHLMLELSGKPHHLPPKGDNIFAPPPLSPEDLSLKAYETLKENILSNIEDREIERIKSSSILQVILGTFAIHRSVLSVINNADKKELEKSFGDFDFEKEVAYAEFTRMLPKYYLAVERGPDAINQLVKSEKGEKSQEEGSFAGFTIKPF